MLETCSEVDINAPAARMWEVLADFRADGRRSPSNRGILDHPVPSGTIEMNLRTASRRQIRSPPTVAIGPEEQAMSWLDRRRLPGSARSERRFRRVRGRPSSDAMASALEKRAERARAKRVNAAIH